MAKKKESTDTLTIDTPSIMKPEIVTFHIVGMSPLLQNNPADFIGKDESEGLTSKKKTYVDEEEARRRLYVNSDDQYCHPTEAFTRALVRAVTGKKFGKISAPALVKGAVFIVENWTPLEDENGNRPEYEIDRRSVVINKKNRILRCRPLFKKWNLNLALEIDTAIIQPDAIRDSLALAGRIIGIGDYRPEKGGGFGRFTIG